MSVTSASDDAVANDTSSFTRSVVTIIGSAVDTPSRRAESGSIGVVNSLDVPAPPPAVVSASRNTAPCPGGGMLRGAVAVLVGHQHRPCCLASDGDLLVDRCDDRVRARDHQHLEADRVVTDAHRARRGRHDDATLQHRCRLALQRLFGTRAQIVTSRSSSVRNSMHRADPERHGEDECRGHRHTRTHRTAQSSHRSTQTALLAGHAARSSINRYPRVRMVSMLALPEGLVDLVP